MNDLVDECKTIEDNLTFTFWFGLSWLYKRCVHVGAHSYGFGVDVISSKSVPSTCLSHYYLYNLSFIQMQMHLSLDNAGWNLYLRHGLERCDNNFKKKGLDCSVQQIVVSRHAQPAPVFRFHFLMVKWLKARADVSCLRCQKFKARLFSAPRASLSYTFLKQSLIPWPDSPKPVGAVVICVSSPGPLDLPSNPITYSPTLIIRQMHWSHGAAIGPLSHQTR